MSANARQSQSQKCVTTGTVTALGIVPHLVHPELGIMMPVHVRWHVRKDGTRDGVAAVSGRGRSEWILPGGAIYVSDQPVSTI